MKKRLAVVIIIVLAISLFGCVTPPEHAQIVATTLPVYEFASALCNGTGIEVAQLITENVSCLHDYTLKVKQMKLLEKAEVIIASGAGLDSFVEDVLTESAVYIDTSLNVEIICTESHHDHDHMHDHGDVDPHIWLSPENAKVMAEGIYNGLVQVYPEYQSIFAENLYNLNLRLEALQSYGLKNLSDLSNNKCITFHDGFAYLANAFGIKILRAIEEESGSEASAQEIIELIELIETNNVAAIFTERNGTASSANILHNETGVPVYELDTAMSGSSYFDSMYHNIDTLKEALK